MTQQPNDQVRAEILDLGDERVLAAQIEIDAPPEVIFDILIQPRRHPEIDGSGSVQAVIEGPERLSLGAKFRMNMRIGVSYHITNKVIAFEPNRLITWAHLLGNQWTYELTPLDGGRTLVRETNNVRAAGWKASLSPAARKLPQIQRSIAKSLVRLKKLAEAEAAAHGRR